MPRLLKKKEDDLLLDDVLLDLCSQGYTQEMIGLEYLNFLVNSDFKGRREKHHCFKKYEKNFFQNETLNYFMSARMNISDVGSLLSIAKEKMSYETYNWKIEHAVFDLLRLTEDERVYEIKGYADANLNEQNESADYFFHALGNSLIYGASKYSFIKRNFSSFKEYNFIYSSLRKRAFVLSSSLLENLPVFVQESL